jgi:hypothetical protein
LSWFAWFPWLGQVSNRFVEVLFHLRGLGKLTGSKLLKLQFRLPQSPFVGNGSAWALNLSEDELAFYDALEVNDSAVKVLGEPTLVQIARELVETVKRNVTIDWTVRENVRAHLRVIVKRILRKYGYPPDKQEKATQTVLEQAEALSHYCLVWQTSGTDEGMTKSSISDDPAALQESDRPLLDEIVPKGEIDTLLSELDPWPRSGYLNARHGRPDRTHLVSGHLSPTDR